MIRQNKVYRICLRCGHSWEQKGSWLPKKCANCNSEYWDSIRRDKKGVI
jgi:predicted  nucleic acid-binding Zn-ribbon protein